MGAEKEREKEGNIDGGETHIDWLPPKHAHPGAGIEPATQVDAWTRNRTHARTIGQHWSGLELFISLKFNPYHSTFHLQGYLKEAIKMTGETLSFGPVFSISPPHSIAWWWERQVWISASSNYKQEAQLSAA